MEVGSAAGTELSILYDSLFFVEVKMRKRWIASQFLLITDAMEKIKPRASLTYPVLGFAPLRIECSDLLPKWKEW